MNADKPHTPAYPIVTAGAGCQSFADARELFIAIEAIAIKHDLDPDRVPLALTALVGLWTSMVEKVKDDQVDTDTVVENTLPAVEHALRSYLGNVFAPVPAGHRH